MPGDQEHRGDRRDRRAEDLRPAVAPELASRHAGQEHGRSRGQRRRDPQHGQRSRRDGVHQRGDRRGQRSLVRIAEGEVVARDEEVELVAVVPVAAGEGDKRRDDDRGDRQQRPHRERRSPLCETVLRAAATIRGHRMDIIPPDADRGFATTTTLPAW